MALKNSEAVIPNNPSTKIDIPTNLTAKSSKSSHQKRSLVVTEKGEAPCICCNKPHRVYHCEYFKKMTVADRHSKIRDSRLCFNFFSPYHGAHVCRSRYNCQHCNGRHNTLLHVDKGSDHNCKAQDMSSVQKDPIKQIDDAAPSSISCCASQGKVTYSFQLS